ncbi:MAG: rod shape-determining protein MreD [Longicatena sp.]
MAHLIFVLICFSLDEILISVFPNSYLLNDLLFIPNLGFCAMILTIRKFDFIDSCLFSFGCGMIYDFVFANSFLVYAIAFTIVACLLQLWSKHLTDTIIESLILCIVTIFVKDLLVYFYMSFQKSTNMSLMEWAEKFELLTLLANAILVMVIVFFIRIKDDYLKMKALRIRKGEKVEWFRLK